MTRSIHAIIPAVLLLALPGVASAQGTSFTVTVVPPVHGKMQMFRPRRPTASIRPGRSSP